MRVPLGRDGWYLCDAANKPGLDFVEFRGDESLARQWLCQFGGEVLYGHLRRLFNLPSRYADFQVRQLVASRLASGVWKARQPARKLQKTGGAPKTESAAFPLDERRAPAPKSSAPVQEQAVFPDDIDPAAIAAVQKQAAELGIPFCEECAKAALAAAGN